jgi:hypothetical protein
MMVGSTNRIAVNWLLRSDIGQVIKEIVDAEKFPDYQIPKKPSGRKKGNGKSRRYAVPSCRCIGGRHRH